MVKELYRLLYGIVPIVNTPFTEDDRIDFESRFGHSVGAHPSDSRWGGTDYVAESNVVDRQVRNLRARFQDDLRSPRFIATVPGQGYRFLLTFPDAAPGAMPKPTEEPANRRQS